MEVEQLTKNAFVCCNVNVTLRQTTAGPTENAFFFKNCAYVNIASGLSDPNQKEKPELQGGGEIKAAVVSEGSKLDVYSNASL